jgi:hypothetical protein
VDRPTKDLGNAIIGTEKVTKSSPMDASIKVIMKIIRCMERGNINGLMNSFMKGSGETI